jgi:carboxyl-terminal processing protease
MTHHLKKYPITPLLIGASLIILLFGGGYKLGEYQTSHSTQAAANSHNIDFTLFWSAWDTVQKSYVDKKKVDPKLMYYGAIKGMVASVNDPYTFFMTPTENQQTKNDLGGKFEGIGAQLGLQDNQVVIIAPLKDSPSEKAGMHAGDVIVTVNGEAIKGMPLAQVVSKVRGDKGTTVTLGITRNGQEMTFKVLRDTIQVHSVELTLDEHLSDCTADCTQVAYLKVNQFGDTTVDEWEQAVTKVQQEWQKGAIKGLVLDLRGNPGGYLESSVYMASDFLKMGQLVVRQESTTYENRDYTVNRGGRLLDIPLTVLIDRGSASAAEILSGALRDHKRAVLVGEKSFGKGSVQEAMDLGNGAGLHITIAKWLLPSGEWINGRGIEPAVKVQNTVTDGNTLTRAMDKQLDAAIQQLLK